MLILVDQLILFLNIEIISIPGNIPTVGHVLYNSQASNIIAYHYGKLRLK